MRDFNAVLSETASCSGKTRISVINNTKVIYFTHIQTHTLQ